jgi:acetaldehyde dehydrogenase (acetylating)
MKWELIPSTIKEYHPEMANIIHNGNRHENKKRGSKTYKYVEVEGRAQYLARWAVEIEGSNWLDNIRKEIKRMQGGWDE